jgi:mycothiol synthase
VSTFRRAEVHALPDGELRPYYELERTAALETWPDDGFLDFDSWATWHRGQPPEHRATLLVAPAANGLDGAARVSWEEVPENRHLAFVEVTVAPASRRRGLGGRLLQEAAEVAQAAGRTLLVGGTSSRTPPGEAFAKSAGASLAMIERENRLRLEDVDRELLRRWLQPAVGYRTVSVDGPSPPELVEEASAMQELMNDAPRGDLQADDFRSRPEHMLLRERTLAAAGFRVWSVYAQQEAGGRLVGFTRLSSHPSRPAVVEQWGTAVAREHRGHGLGRLLKATNLDRVLSELPGAREVTTTNADTNRWMLAINHELGFRQVAEWHQWQLETAPVLRYTSRQSARPLE